MDSGCPPFQPLPSIAEHVGEALQLLARALSYAEDSGRSVWDFAVEIDRLQTLGVSECELRWLVCKGFVTNAQDVSDPKQDGRQFTGQGCLRFSSNTCFVLTDGGRPLVESVGRQPAEVSLIAVPAVSTANGTRSPSVKPDWDAVLRVLSVGDQVVKRYRVPAENQELILSVFDEEGWARRIDDPLPPIGQDPKKRLQSVIMCLNRNQKARLIRFRGDGNGTGVTWELSGAAS